MARVVIEHLTKIFKAPKGEEVWAVRDVSLVIEDRELVVLVGPSGCGKSTLLRMIAGLEDITRGRILLDGQVVNDVPPKDRDIAMVFQNYALYPHMTVYENLAFGLKLRKFLPPEIKQRINAAASLLGLAPCLDRLPKALSGGQRQRVAVGRALVRQPKVFLFDEPLSNLDAPMRVQMRAELSRLHDRLGATMIYVTHDQVEALTLGDRVAVMKEGVIQQVANPLALYQKPANLFVAGFIGSPPMNFFKGILVRQSDRLSFCTQNDLHDSSARGFTVPLSDEQAARLERFVDHPVILGMRPEHLVPQAAAIPEQNSITATVEVVEPMGSETHLHFVTEAQSFVARVESDFPADCGQPVSVRLNMAQAHFFDPDTEQALA